MIERWDVIQDQSLMVVDAVLDGEIDEFINAYLRSKVGEEK